MLSNDRFFNFIDDICPYVDIQDFDWYYRRFDEMYHLSFERPPLYHLHAKSILLAILSKLYCDIKSQPKFNIMENPCYHELLQIRKYLDMNYMVKLSLSDISGMFSMCQEHLCRSFHAAFDVSPMQYLNSVRMHHARQMLVFSDASIETIARECGFSSTQFFYKAFRRETGTTPQRFRRARRGEIWQ